MTRAMKSSRADMFMGRPGGHILHCELVDWALRGLKKRPEVLAASESDHWAPLYVNFGFGALFFTSGARGGSGLCPEPP